MEGRPILYDELADWWPLLSAPSDYAEHAAFFGRTLQEHSETTPRTLLELGSGGGNNASHLKRTFALTLVDLSPQMLRVSAELNPECAHHVGDMRSARLGREFDCVFVQDAVSYMTTPDDLHSAVRTAFVHCRARGVALFAPDFVRETFEPSTECGGRDDGIRGLRYVAWTWDPDPSDTTFVTDFAYLLRRDAGEPQVRWDRHVQGLFSTADWLATLRDVGFIATELDHRHSDGPAGTKVFVGVRPAADT
ncbi:MAG: class I SAM-dependent methyltransferase [Gemmatimonadota bacterium]|nr:class I SAM-dependent methyltransferase [Gemmatimonadota bacterium]